MTADALVDAQSALAAGQGLLFAVATGAFAVVLVTGFYNVRRETALTGARLLGLGLGHVLAACSRVSSARRCSAAGT
uniref:hypothetical protein n=1 Tax=Burkholderia sp. LMG 13014 TaxID=2709306 RepID=UPI001964DCBE